MKDYKIIKFEERAGQVVREFALDERSGEYTCAGRENKGKLDLIGDGNIHITEVERPQGNPRQLGPERFKLNDNLNHNGLSKPIYRISFVKNKVNLHIAVEEIRGGHPGVADTLIPMAQAVKYVAPVVVPVVAKKAKIKAPIAPVRQANNAFQVIEDRIWESLLAELEMDADDELVSSPIRLEKTKKVRREGLHEFLIAFFTTWNNEKNTVWADSVVEVDEDYKIQTPAKKKRSLGDIYMICKYYYPNITLTDVLRELYVALPAHYASGFRSCVCGQINKRVWWYSTGEPNNVNQRTTNDEFGKPYRFYIENL